MGRQRGTERKDDSLDLLGRLGPVFDELFEAWQASDPSERQPGARVKAEWKRGTVAKLILEQGAVRVAALDDVVRVLQHQQEVELAEDVGGRLSAAKTCLARIDACSKGVTALDLRYSRDLEDAIEALRNLWVGDMRKEHATLPAIAGALGTARDGLRSAKFVRAHAPLHPSTQERWYRRIPLLVRLHAWYDALRSLPSAESKNWADKEMADRIERYGHLDA